MKKYEVMDEALHELECYKNTDFAKIVGLSKSLHEGFDRFLKGNEVQFLIEMLNEEVEKADKFLNEIIEQSYKAQGDSE